MDGMESDMVLEVPDTPDRLSIRRLVDGSSKPCWDRVNFRGGDGPSCLPVRNTYIRRNSSSTTAISNDAEFLYREANLARQISNAAEAKAPSQSQSKPVELRHENVFSGNGGKSRETIDLGGRIPSTVSYPRWRGRSLSGTRIPLTADHSVVKDEKRERLYGDNVGFTSRDKGKGVDLRSISEPRNGCIALCSVEKANIRTEVGCQNVSNSVDVVTCSSPAGISARDNGKGTDLCRGSEFVSEQPTLPRISGQRRLVRNGCISPLNIERCKNVVKSKEVEVGKNGILSHQEHIISPDSEGKRADKMKGKITVEDIVAADKQHVRDKSQSSRVCSLPGKEVIIIADMEGSVDRFEDKGWRTTRNHMGKLSTFPSCRTGSILKSEDTSGHPTNEIHGVAMRNEVTALRQGLNPIQVPDHQELQTKNRRIKGKRKLGLSDYRVGECSTSISNDPGSSYIRSSRQPLNSRSTRSCKSQRDDILLGPIIEVDELQSPEAVYSNPYEHDEQMCRASEVSIARDWQVESDEILAHQLQEEFYNETPETAETDEIAAAIALLLEDGDGRASIARQHQSRRRDSSSSSVRSRFREPAVRTTNRAHFPTSNRMAQVRRNFNSSMMDLNMRLDILGAFAFGDGHAARTNNILQTQRDFTENDYEMLLALDENNHQHGGASESQINNLPQSVIQNVDSQEACAVCLEPPSIGDIIRHLPCLHKFHKECIDTWLRRKMSCPICKFGIR